MPPRKPLVLLGLEPLSATTTRDFSAAAEDFETPRKRWYHHLPLCGTVLLLLSPHPSLLYVLVDFHLKTLEQPLIFATHLFATYGLTFLALSSLIVCVARDPGPVTLDAFPNEGDNEEVGLTEALMPDNDLSAPGRWCRKCWAPKPERTHHCSHCGRCVLKMDHHCPWLGSKCIGHRTYPAFVHFLCCVTLLATYIATMSISALWFAFNNPIAVSEVTPIHELILAFAGIIFSLVIGSFFFYHVYLVTTNQTTLENISPFMLLRYIPNLPHVEHGQSEPLLEHELSFKQRRLVKDAHGHIHMYDVGWRRNWAQVFGWSRRFGWLYRLWCGGASQGNGRDFARNPQAEEMLARLASELMDRDRDG